MAEEENHYSCTECSKSFSCKRYLTKHVLRGHRSKPKKSGELACSMCAKKFPSLSHLQRHQLSHLNVREFECPCCSKTFVQKDKLHAHLKWIHQSANPESEPAPSTSSHKDQVQSPFICTVCSVAFRSNWHLRRHQKRRHVTVTCEVCDEVFDSLELARAHRVTHEVEKNFVCSICSRRFSRSAELRAHEQIHLRLGSFLCVPCNSVFIQRIQLNRHIKRVHPIQRNCYECGEKFSAISQYTSHMQIIHDRVTCAYCGDDDCSTYHIETAHWRKLKNPLPSGATLEKDGNKTVLKILVVLEKGTETEVELHREFPPGLTDTFPELRNLSLRIPGLPTDEDLTLLLCFPVDKKAVEDQSALQFIAAPLHITYSPS